MWKLKKKKKRRERKLKKNTHVEVTFQSWDVYLV